VTVQSEFTSKERDSETGLDFFGARYMSSAQGRWTSPDWSAKPEPVPYAKPGNPQSLNLYQYMLNNPLAGIDPDGHQIDCSGANAQGVGCQTIADWNGKHGMLTNESKAAIGKSVLSPEQQKSFTNAVLTASGRGNIDPNILVGIAQQESGLGAQMNATGAAKGLYGIQDVQMKQINEMFTLNIATSDLLSFSAGSMTKVSTGVADYLGHYAELYSNWPNPRGIEVAISAWRIGIGQTRKNLRAGAFWDYVDPNLKESVAHYVGAVERFDQ
jgi:RHS repeat-associated protein